MNAKTEVVTKIGVYDDFIAGVQARTLADGRDVIRIFHKGDKVHLVGDVHAVGQAAKVLERRKFSTVAHAVNDDDIEISQVEKDLEEMLQSIPTASLPRLGAAIERARETLGLPRLEPVSKTLEAIDTAVLGRKPRSDVVFAQSIAEVMGDPKVLTWATKMAQDKLSEDQFIDRWARHTTEHRINEDDVLSKARHLAVEKGLSPDDPYIRDV